MWLTVLTILIVSVYEYFALKMYRIYKELPAQVKKRDTKLLLYSSALILAVVILVLLCIPSFRII